MKLDNIDYVVLILLAILTLRLILNAGFHLFRDSRTQRWTSRNWHKKIARSFVEPRISGEKMLNSMNFILTCASLYFAYKAFEGANKTEKAQQDFINTTVSAMNSIIKLDSQAVRLTRDQNEIMQSTFAFEKKREQNAKALLSQKPKIVYTLLANGTSYSESQMRNDTILLQRIPQGDNPDYVISVNLENLGSGPAHDIRFNSIARPLSVFIHRANEKPFLSEENRIYDSENGPLAPSIVTGSKGTSFNIYITNSPSLSKFNINFVTLTSNSKVKQVKVNFKIVEKLL